MKETTKEIISSTVKECRNQLGMTQLEVAKAAKLNRATVSRIEAAAYMPSIDQLQNIAEILHFDIADLFILKKQQKSNILPKYTIAVAGTGYVGLSLSTLLAQHNKVIAYDISPEKVDQINKRLPFRTTILNNI